MGDTLQCQLKDIAEIQTGPFGSQLHMSDYVKVGTPIITVEHFGENKIIHENLPLVNDLDKNRLIKYTLQEGDVVFSRVGSVDRRVYITAQEDGWMFSGRCLRFRPIKNKVNGKYLSYYFGQESFKEYIRMVAVGATMPSINTQILSEAEVIIHEIPEQESIAEVLSSLDDKIDLLIKNNKTMEQLAETLFRQWFVEEADTQEKSLGDIAEVTSGKGLNKKEFSSEGIYPVFGSNGIIGKTNKQLYDEHLIITGRVGTLGTVRIVSEKCWISDNVLIVKPKEECYFYPIYFSMKNYDYPSLNVGSTQPLITQTEIKTYYEFYKQYH